MKKNQKYYLKAFKNRQTYQSTFTRKFMRFSYFLRLIPWQIEGLQVYLKVTYVPGLDTFGKTVEFYNDGTYENESDFNEALTAFREV